MFLFLHDGHPHDPCALLPGPVRVYMAEHPCNVPMSIGVVWVTEMLVSSVDVYHFDLGYRMEPPPTARSTGS